MVRFTSQECLLNGPSQRRAYQKDILEDSILAQKAFHVVFRHSKCGKHMLCEHVLDSRFEYIFKSDDAQRIRTTPLPCILTSKERSRGTVCLGSNIRRLPHAEIFFISHHRFSQITSTRGAIHRGSLCTYRRSILAIKNCYLIMQSWFP